MVPLVCLLKVIKLEKQVEDNYFCILLDMLVDLHYCNGPSTMQEASKIKYPNFNCLIFSISIQAHLILHKKEVSVVLAPIMYTYL